MEKIIINTIINDHNIRFSELKKYKGKKAQIIFLIDEKEQRKVKSVGGILSGYADPAKKQKEKNVWNKTMNDKHGNC